MFSKAIRIKEMFLAVKAVEKTSIRLSTVNPITSCREILSDFCDSWLMMLIMKTFHISWLTVCKLFVVFIPSPNYIIKDLLEMKIWSRCSVGVISVSFNFDELIYVFFEPNPIDAKTFTVPLVRMEILDL